MLNDVLSAGRIAANVDSSPAGIHLSASAFHVVKQKRFTNILRPPEPDRRRVGGKRKKAQTHHSEKSCNSLHLSPLEIVISFGRCLESITLIHSTITPKKN